MSKIWSHASTNNPCPICGKTDWCTFGDKAVLCQRVESNRPYPKGGWFHFYENAPEKPRYIPKAKEAPKKIDAAKIMRMWRGATNSTQFNILAEQLGVIVEAVVAIGAAWAPQYRAWAFPMRDGYGETIGIRLRNSDGFKWAVPGSRQGIFLPESCVKATTPAFLPEGPTDTVAGLSLGLFTIGRPTCNSGGDHIKVALKRLGIHRAVIVTDNDEMKKRPDGSEWRPGIEGSNKLKKELALPSVIWQPTGDIKDMREFLKRGGSRAIIEAQIKDRVWSKS